MWVAFSTRLKHKNVSNVPVLSALLATGCKSPSSTLQGQAYHNCDALVQLNWGVYYFKCEYVIIQT